jgi:putative transposase
MRYKATRADDAGLRQRMKAIARERRRFGHRRMHVLLKREGYVQRALPTLPGREACDAAPWRPQVGTRAPMIVPGAPNDRRSLDFVSDQPTDGRRFRILTVVDDCTRA